MGMAGQDQILGSGSHLGQVFAVVDLSNPLTWTAQTWTALAAWVTVLVAVVAATAAFRQVGQARETREAQAQPFVVVSLEQSREEAQWFVLRVENIGKTLARDVKFTFDPPLESRVAESKPSFEIATSHLLTAGLPSMPPGMRIERVIDDAMLWGEGFKNAPQLAYEVTVEFSDYRGRSQEPLRYVVDLTPYLSGHFIEVRTIHHVGNSLRNIEQMMKSWGESSRGLAVWNRDGDARDAREREWFRAQRERIAEKGTPTSSD